MLDFNASINARLNTMLSGYGIISEDIKLGDDVVGGAGLPQDELEKRKERALGYWRTVVSGIKEKSREEALGTPISIPYATPEAIVAPEVVDALRALGDDFGIDDFDKAVQHGTLMSIAGKSEAKRAKKKKTTGRQIVSQVDNAVKKLESSINLSRREQERRAKEWKSETANFANLKNLQAELDALKKQLEDKQTSGEGEAEETEEARSSRKKEIEARVSEVEKKIQNINVSMDTPLQVGQEVRLPATKYRSIPETDVYITKDGDTINAIIDKVYRQRMERLHSATAGGLGYSMRDIEPLVAEKTAELIRLNSGQLSPSFSAGYTTEHLKDAQLRMYKAMEQEIAEARKARREKGIAQIKKAYQETTGDDMSDEEAALAFDVRDKTFEDGTDMGITNKNAPVYFADIVADQRASDAKIDERLSGLGLTNKQIQEFKNVRAQAKEKAQKEGGTQGDIDKKTTKYARDMAQALINNLNDSQRVKLNRPYRLPRDFERLNRIRMPLIQSEVTGNPEDDWTVEEILAAMDGRLWALASNYNRKFRDEKVPFYSREDAYQEGRMGVLHAIEHDKGWAVFGQYATKIALQYMKKGLEEAIHKLYGGKSRKLSPKQIVRKAEEAAADARFWAKENNFTDKETEEYVAQAKQEVFDNEAKREGRALIPGSQITSQENEDLDAMDAEEKGEKLVRGVLYRNKKTGEERWFQPTGIRGSDPIEREEPKKSTWDIVRDDNTGIKSVETQLRYKVDEKLETLKKLQAELQDPNIDENEIRKISKKIQQTSKFITDTQDKRGSIRSAAIIKELESTQWRTLTIKQFQGMLDNFNKIAGDDKITDKQKTEINNILGKAENKKTEKHESLLNAIYDVIWGVLTEKQRRIFRSLPYGKVRTYIPTREELNALRELPANAPDKDVKAALEKVGTTDVQRIKSLRRLVLGKAIEQEVSETGMKQSMDPAKLMAGAEEEALSIDARKKIVDYINNEFKDTSLEQEAILRLAFDLINNSFIDKMTTEVVLRGVDNNRIPYKNEKARINELAGQLRNPETPKNEREAIVNEYNSILEDIKIRERDRVRTTISSTDVKAASERPRSTAKFKTPEGETEEEKVGARGRPLPLHARPHGDTRSINDIIYIMLEWKFSEHTDSTRKRIKENIDKVMGRALLGVLSLPGVIRPKRIDVILGRLEQINKSFNETYETVYQEWQEGGEESKWETLVKEKGEGEAREMFINDVINRAAQKLHMTESEMRQARKIIGVMYGLGTGPGIGLNISVADRRKFKEAFAGDIESEEAEYSQAEARTKFPWFAKFGKKYSEIIDAHKEGYTPGEILHSLYGTVKGKPPYAYDHVLHTEKMKELEAAEDNYEKLKSDLNKTVALAKSKKIIPSPQLLFNLDLTDEQRKNMRAIYKSALDKAAGRVKGELRHMRRMERAKPQTKDTAEEPSRTLPSLRAARWLSPVAKQEVDRLVALLASEERETAFERLLEMGPDVIPLLEKHRNNADAREQINDIIGRLRADIRDSMRDLYVTKATSDIIDNVLTKEQRDKLGRYEVIEYGDKISSMEDAAQNASNEVERISREVEEARRANILPGIIEDMINNTDIFKRYTDSVVRGQEFQKGQEPAPEPESERMKFLRPYVIKAINNYPTKSSEDIAGILNSDKIQKQLKNINKSRPPEKLLKESDLIVTADEVAEIRRVLTGKAEVETTLPELKSETEEELAARTAEVAAAKETEVEHARELDEWTRAIDKILRLDAQGRSTDEISKEVGINAYDVVALKTLGKSGREITLANVDRALLAVAAPKARPTTESWAHTYRMFIESAASLLPGIMADCANHGILTEEIMDRYING